jgi:transposase
MQPLTADRYRWIVGIDTHAATHSYAILDTTTGRITDQQTFPTHPAGLARALDWIGRRTSTGPDQVLISAECTGSYGATIADRLTGAGYRVTEAPTPHRAGGPKTDPIDAVAAASSAAAALMSRLRDWRSGQTGQGLEVLTCAREQMNHERSAAICTLTGLLRRFDLGADARHTLTGTQIAEVARWRERAGDRIGEATARAEAVRLARRVTDLDAQLKTNLAAIDGLVGAVAPELLDLFGVGPVSAAVIISAWSRPGRIRSEAGFAALAGVSPVAASSGKTVRYRLNRGGDRRLNAALYRIVMTRARGDQATREYVERRTRQGRTRTEIWRCLKRYVARSIWRLLNRAHPVCADEPAQVVAAA